MNRRAADRKKDRLVPLLLALSIAQGLLSCVLGYKAIKACDSSSIAQDEFASTMRTIASASRMRRESVPLPGDEY